MSTGLPEAYSPRALYLLMHHATWSGAYFQRVLRSALLASHEDADVVRYRTRLVGALRQEQPYVASLVRTAAHLAEEHGLDVPGPPRLPTDWDPWVRAILAEMRDKLDLAVPTSAPVPFGFDHGQARATLAVLLTLLEISARGVDVTHEVSQAVLALREISGRWPASITLVSKLHGSDPLVQAWRPAQDALTRLAQSHVGTLDGAVRDGLLADAGAVLLALGELEHSATATLSADT